jgi:hypothetical protein
MLTNFMPREFVMPALATGGIDSSASESPRPKHNKQAPTWLAMIRNRLAAVIVISTLFHANHPAAIYRSKAVHHECLAGYLADALETALLLGVPKLHDYRAR